MIFLTVGHQTPFDRLVKAMDEWAASNPQEVIKGQIGEGSYLPKHFDFQRWLSAAEFEAALTGADCIVAHAGTGTIIEALERSKPILVVPRLAALGETRNDHQIGTARYFSEAGLVKALSLNEKLETGLDHLNGWRPQGDFSKSASKPLLNRLDQFLREVEAAE